VCQWHAKRVPLARHWQGAARIKILLAPQLARDGNGPMSAGEVVAQFNVPKRTAYNWLAKYGKGETDRASIRAVRCSMNGIQQTDTQTRRISALLVVNSFQTTRHALELRNSPKRGLTRRNW